MTLGKNHIHIITLLTLAIAGGAQAQDSSEQDELNQFMNLLEQQTSLATDTRINADYVPGMLSVLSAEQMERRGFRTLWEALASLPGVQATINETGMRSITVRGIGEIFEPSKVKLLLNGKALNASASATAGTLYETPIEQIERVEFIRGPGSAIYGEFAFAGVVNVITRQQGERYSAGIESGDGYTFSALYSYADPGGDFKTSINFAASQSEGENISAGIDGTPERTPIEIPSYAPGPINNKRDFVSAILSVESGDLVALLQIQQSNRGDHFGTNNLLPPDDRQTVISESTISADISQSFELDDVLTGAWSLNLLHNETEQNSLFLGDPENFGGLGPEDDIIADTLLEEQRIEAQLNLQYEVSEHKIFGALVFTEVEVREAELFINLITTPGGPPSPTLNEFPTPVDDSAERGSVSLVLQDEYRIDDRLTLTAGLRYDNYEDIDSNVSPRIALVWRRTDQHIFKTQLARAFKPPSLIEDSGSLEVDIESETNDTLEFGHIYQGADLVLRNTIYFSKLDNLILFQDFAPFGFYNSGSFDLRGYELEVEKSIDHEWDINASLSLQDYADDKLPGAAPWMLKLGVEYALMPLAGLHLQVNSFGSRDREEADTRGDFEQTTQADVSLRMQNFNDIDGLTFRAGILNVLDDELKHPAPFDTYPDDYPYSDGAMLWAQFIYQP